MHQRISPICMYIIIIICRLSGRIDNNYLVSVGQKLRLNFVSDDKDERPGFAARYKCIDGQIVCFE